MAVAIQKTGAGQAAVDFAIAEKGVGKGNPDFADFFGGEEMADLFDAGTEEGGISKFEV